ncbi:glutathione synthase [Candidatus Njordibacter sp. Uisw_058]|uniref:glutathione synthase n=1 Tax=Candidatus Njordibacter sp. Uisw_058 TaxID=3230974 RepID=UPI003D3F834B
MTIRLGIIMDPIHNINFKKDSSLAMLWAAQDLGWQIFYMEPQHLYAEQGVAMGLMAPLSVMRDAHHFYELDEQLASPLGDLDVILMRKDPPFDSQFLHTTYLLSQAEDAGALIINKPQSLRDCNEKLFATQFPECCPEVLVASDAKVLKAFHARHGDVIFKPLDGMGGTSIFRARKDEPNLNVIIETLTEFGQQQIMVQRYLPAIKDGDKRILMINGYPVDHVLARIPSSGETRGNLAAGGSGVARPLSERDQWICEQIGPTLRAKEIHFAGLDVIGDSLTEINVTSPTCIREIDDQTGSNIAAVLMQHISQLLAARST